jgi:hypothetical protein
MPTGPLLSRSRRGTAAHRRFRGCFAQLTLARIAALGFCTMLLLTFASNAHADFTVTEGSAFSGTIGEFDTICAPRPPAVGCVPPRPPVTVTVDWGDQSSSVGHVSSLGCDSPCTEETFAVTATHTYREAGIYTYSARGITGTATVTDAPLSAGQAATFSTVEGTGLANAVVATFTDGNPLALATDFSATINWGDSETDSAIVSAAPSGGFAVTGTHAYTALGTHPVTTVITDSGGSNLTMTGSTTVTAALSGGRPAAVAAVAQRPYSGLLATFTDSTPDVQPSELTATVSWGDSNTSPGIVTPGPNGSFQVNGSHIYAQPGIYPITVDITAAGIGPLSITGSASVSETTSTGTGTGTGTSIGTGTGSSTGTGSGAGSRAAPTAHTPPLNVGTNLSIRHLTAGAETASMDITCAKHAVHACHGTLAATTRASKHSHAKAAANSGAAIVARTRFSVAAGKTARVELRLNRVGRGLVRARYQLAVTVALTGTSRARFGVTYGYVRVPTVITYDATYSKTCCGSDPVNDVVFTNVPRGARLAMVCGQGVCVPDARTFRAHGQTLKLGSRVVVTLPPHASVDFEVIHPHDIGEAVEVTNPGVGPPPFRLLCLPPWLHHPVACPSD